MPRSCAASAASSSLIACGPGEQRHRVDDALLPQAAQGLLGLPQHPRLRGALLLRHRRHRDGIHRRSVVRAHRQGLGDGAAGRPAAGGAWTPSIRSAEIGLIVDEWGTWHPVEQGTNPAFLYQQNTLRDALVAATTLDIFNRHADKVVMANIAQTVNVLQAMVLTEGERMLRHADGSRVRDVRAAPGRQQPCARFGDRTGHFKRAGRTKHCRLSPAAPRSRARRSS